MRCKNCGWDNIPNTGKCIKCNLILTEESGTRYNDSPQEEVNLRKTVNENVIFKDIQSEPTNRVGDNCSKCGYPVISNMNECPNCGNSSGNNKEGNNKIKCYNCRKEIIQGVSYCSHCGMSQHRAKQDINSSDKGAYGRQTIRPGRRSHCTLILIPEEKEKLEPVELSFSGDEIVLSRDNTEPDNLTITSQEQAVLTYENRKWYIENRSDLKTTYIQVSDRMELKPGDVIMLGDRRFEFDY